MALCWSPGWEHSPLEQLPTESLPALLDCTLQRSIGPCLCWSHLCPQLLVHCLVHAGAQKIFVGRWKELDNFSINLEVIERLWSWATWTNLRLVVHFLVPSLPSKDGREWRNQTICQGHDLKYVLSLSDLRKFNLLLKGVGVTRWVCRNFFGDTCYNKEILFWKTFKHISVSYMLACVAPPIKFSDSISRATAFLKDFTREWRFRIQWHKIKF